VTFDAVILAASPHATTKLLGLSLVERGRRVAEKAGARRIHIIDGDDAAARLSAWDSERGDAALLVIRAGDQLVHLPLVKPLIAGVGDRRLAVGPDGTFAGALWAAGAHANEAIAAIEASPTTADTSLAAAWTDATKIEHGDIARHPATTPAEHKAAAKMLLRILVKPAEDSPVSQYVYRPLSRPLTVMLCRTPITPNQVSYVVALIGLAGCVLTAMASQACLVWGAFLVFLSCVIDGCDGEIARLKMEYSPFGAWLDTIIDELTQVSYFFAIGYHTYQWHPEPYILWSIAIGGVLYLGTIYAIYYFSLVVIKKGGSQYYESDVELFDDDQGPALRKRPKVSTAPPWVQSLMQIALYMIRRDFINLGSLILAFFNLYVVIYAGIWVGTIVAGLITIPAHFSLMRKIAEIRRRGAPLRYVSD
jgi:phosphatidylglycerophosphate synthase